MFERDRTQDESSAPRLDAREEHVRIASPIEGLSLFLRALPPQSGRATTGKVVLYVHGGTFPSALSIAHRFDGRSWRDELCGLGFDVWGFDFLGFGLSDRYPEMVEPAEQRDALGTAAETYRQIECVVRWICAHRNVPRVSIIAHSWGTIPAGRFAAACPELVDRLVFFGPITWRAPTTARQRYPAWRLVTLDDQWSRFTEDVPKGAPPVLARRDFEGWAPLYLDSDAESRTRTPASVKNPSGPWQDIADAWSGQLAYEPGRIRAPIAIIRGEWDSLATDADAGWLFDALWSSPQRRDIKIAGATHLMHLEQNRYALYREVETFLSGRDLPATTCMS